MSKAAGGRGLLVVVSGPSGSGKDTVLDRLVEGPGFERAVTATTREPRPGEVDGVDYHFRTEAEFREGIERGEYLEHATVHGRLYGTPRREVEEILGRGGVCILAIDVQGAAALRGRVKRARFVFLAPPDLGVLERRLRGRGTESEDQLRVRLETARAEMERRTEYDVTVVNDDLDEAVQELRRRIREWHGGR